MTRIPIQSLQIIAMLLTISGGVAEGADHEITEWLGDPVELRAYRATAIPALVFARAEVNAAVFEFAQAIPKDAPKEALEHLDEILSKRIWDDADGSNEVVSALVDAYVRSAPNRSIFDLLQPKLGPPLVNAVFKKLGDELSEAERSSLLSVLEAANGSLEDREQVRWAYLVNKRMSQKKVIMSEQECLQLGKRDDFHLYIASMHRVSTGRDPIAEDFSKLWKAHHQNEFFGTAMLSNDILTNPKMSSIIAAVGRGILEDDWTPARESALFGIITTVPVKIMSEDIVALIRDIVARPIALPETVEIAGIDQKVSEAHYKLLSKQYGSRVLKKVGER